MAMRLAGKDVALSLADDITARIENLKKQGCMPTLAILRVGERPDDLSYERTALKRAESLGLATRSIVLDANATQAELIEKVHEINEDADIHGCLMFRPLPTHIDEELVCNELSFNKDIDGISARSLASVFMDGEEGFPPCTAQACVSLLDHYQIPVEGKHVVVIGRSLVIGKPVAMMLLRRNASVTMCHSRTRDLPALVKGADIVICATGRARAYDARYFSAGQIVLDVGINFDAEGNLCGDVDYDAVEPIVEAITPVPGGIGSVTTSITMLHTVKAAERALKA